MHTNWIGSDNFWGAIDDARNGKIDMAISKLEKELIVEPDDIICELMIEILRSDLDANSAKKRAMLYKSQIHVEAYAHIAKSPVVSNLHLAANNIMVDMINKEDPITIIDIGIGPGEQMVKLVSALRNSGYQGTIDIFGIDISEQMIEKSSIKLSKLPDVRTQFMLGKFEDIPIKDIRKILGNTQISALVASISIHHVPRAKKVDLLRKIRLIDPRLFVLGEVNSDHEDYLEYMSDKYIYNLRRFFLNVHWGLIDSTDDLRLREQYKCFNTSESLVMLAAKNPQEREDWHTDAENWINLIESSDMRVISSKSEWMNNLSDEASREHKYISTYQNNGQKIFFAVAAKMS